MPPLEAMLSEGSVICEAPSFALSPLSSDDTRGLKSFSIDSSDSRLSPAVSSEMGSNHVFQRSKNSSVDFSRDPDTSFSQFGGTVPFLR